MQFPDDESVMRYALQLADRGRGGVEPNPLVGAVLVQDDRTWIAEGFHQQFGGPHAEIHALQAAGDRCSGATLFVTLEPCSHFGKTPPCADAVIRAGIRRVVIGCLDPAPHVAGQGIARLQAAGVDVVTGVCSSEAQRLIAPFRRLQLDRRPWVHGKWAMTLDGRIASSSGHSRWISCEQSRAIVHELRGWMDAIITGAGTVRSDDPLLTVRPPGPRCPLRVVLDPRLSAVSPASRIMRTIEQAPVLIVTTSDAPDAGIAALRTAGAEVMVAGSEISRVDGVARIDPLEVLQELGRRQVTNALLECGSHLLGAFHDQQLIDELHVFIAPRVIGGRAALSPIGGKGLLHIPAAANVSTLRTRVTGSDLYVQADCLYGQESC